MSFYNFDNDYSQEKLTDDEKKQLEFVQQEMAQIEEEIRTTIQSRQQAGNKVHFDKMTIKNLTLEGEDMVAWTIVSKRMLDSGLMTTGEFFKEVIRYGLRGMLDAERGNRALYAMSAAVLSGLPEEMVNSMKIPAIKKGLKELMERRRKAVEKEFRPGKDDVTVEQGGKDA